MSLVLVQEKENSEQAAYFVIKVLKGEELRYQKI